MNKLPTIPEFFKNKNVFVTGGSGFIGKVLIEKLLRSCPDVKNIYLLMRSKKGKSPEERIKTITDLGLFDVLKSENPEAFKKIKIIPGDVSELNLGLRSSDRQILIDEIDIIFHGAASVRFDEPLSDAIIMNTRGTQEMLNLALEMKHLLVLLHISTTYCNTDRQVIGEQLYPAHADWEKTIEIVENFDKSTLNVLTQKYISPLPNTYTFAKSLAEHVVYDLGNGKLPIVIFRPSIVVSTAHDPFPGWIDNFNGPVGILIASGKGIVRTVYCDSDLIADYVPVDLVVKAIIISAWKKATAEDPKEKFETTFYNGSNNNVQPVSVRQMIEMGKTLTIEAPFNNVLWYPNGSVTKCFYFYYIITIFYQIFPAIIIDGLLKISGHKPILLKIQRRIYNANMALQYFLYNQWQFINDNAISLEESLLPDDLATFSYNKDNLEVYDYFLKAKIGGKKYLLKEDDQDVEKARKNTQRMWLASKIFNFLWYLVLFWLIFVKIDIISIIINKCNNAYFYLITE